MNGPGATDCARNAIWQFRPHHPAGRWWAARVSNPRPPACQAGALPAELAARGGMGAEWTLILGLVPEYIGRRMPRREDERLITGRGRYAGDIKLEGMLHLALSRSPVPHARMVGIETEAARAMPGVVAVWTAADLPQATPGLSDFAPVGIERRGRPILSRDEVNYVGEAYAVVVAETAYQARDAADAVAADLEVLPGVGDVSTAIAEGAARVHDDMNSNLALSSKTAFGDVEGAFASDSVVARIRLTTARVCGAAIEPRTVTAEPGDGIKLWTSTQAVFNVRNAVASILGLEQEQVRVLAEDVGGGFGAKGSVFAEELLTALTAWRLKRPVRWVASRRVMAPSSSSSCRPAATPSSAACGAASSTTSAPTPARAPVNPTTSCPTWSRPTSCRRWISWRSSCTRTRCPPDSFGAAGVTWATSGSSA